MPKQRIILIIGIVLAVAAVAMINIYMGQQKQRIATAYKKAFEQVQANQTAVLVAKKDLPKGTVIDPDMLAPAIVPNQYVQPQAATSLDRISGMMVIAPIAEGEQITMSKLSSAREAASGSLAMATPAGKRAVTIAVDDISSVGGMIRPGDYVDIIATVPIPTQTAEGKQAAQLAVVPLFQNVLILAVGQETKSLPETEEASRYQQKQEKKETASLITLALTSQEANLLAFVQEQGKIRLTLRSPTDAKIEPVQPASWETLFQYIMPRETNKPETKEEPSSAALVKEEYIEIYRGLNKEKMPLSK
jgi:pilus assembly protein CpaB